MTGHIVRTFDRWHAFIDAADKSTADYKSNAHLSNEECRAELDRGRGDWTLGVSFDDAVRMARTVGWREQIKSCDAYCRDVRALVESEREEDTFTHSLEVAGAEVEMGRYLTGVPECMAESLPLKVSGQGPVVRLVVDVSAPCGACGGQACPCEPTDSSAIRDRGFAIVSLADALHRARHGLEIWAAHTVAGYMGDDGRYIDDYKDVQHHTVAVCVQHANAPVDMGRLVFALAHPAMLRRLVFGVEEAGEHRAAFEFIHGYRYGYTYVPGASPDGARNVNLDDVPKADGTTLLLPPIRSGEEWSVDRAAAWVTDTLAEIGLVE